VGSFPLFFSVLRCRATAASEALKLLPRPQIQTSKLPPGSHAGQICVAPWEGPLVLNERAQQRQLLSLLTWRALFCFGVCFCLALAAAASRLLLIAGIGPGVLQRSRTFGLASSQSPRGIATTSELSAVNFHPPTPGRTFHQPAIALCAPCAD
jgi:hypothetical protein